MPSHNGHGTGLESQLRKAMAELACRLRYGKDCRAEEFFAASPDLASDKDSALDLIFKEFETREELGQSPSREVFLARFPAWRDGLEDIFNKIDEETIKEGPELQDYELIEEIGRGEMSVVWKARQFIPKRDVVVKMFPGGDHEDLERFRRGAKDQARLKHPNIVEVYVVGDSGAFFAMEYLEGGSLDQKIAGRAQPAEYVARCVETLARAMHFAHEEGIIHRDLKPANVLFTADGVPKITDFGLAKQVGRKTIPGESGALIGTIPYMAPEQAACKTKSIDRRTDVYALGVILYESLTGRRPCAAKTLPAIFKHIESGLPVPPHRLEPGVDRRLESICLKCLEKKPRKRYRTAQALADDLKRWSEGKRPCAHDWSTRTMRSLRRHCALSLAAVLLVFASIIIPLAYYFTNPEREWERIRDKLAHGEKVTLIGHEGRPHWHQWVTSEETQQDLLGPDGTFKIQSKGLALKKLVRDPQHAHYRITARIRHDESFGATSEVGIYFAYCRETTTGLDPCYCLVAFNGLTDWRRRLPRFKGNSVHVTVRRMVKPGQKVTSIMTAGPPQFLPIEWMTIGTWVNVVVEVSPEKIRFTISKDNDPEPEPQEVSREKLDYALKEMFPNANGLPPKFDTTDLPRGALGLYIRQGSASFQDVEVIPIP